MVKFAHFFATWVRLSDSSLVIAISQECLLGNFAQILIFTCPTIHLLWVIGSEQLFFLNSHATSPRNFQKWYKMFVYHLIKIYFMIKWSPSKGASMYQVSSNSETKNFSAPRTPKGPSKFFGSTKKIIYLPKLVNIKKLME